MNRFYCLLLLLCPYVSMAQPPALQSIQPGDQVPNIAFNSLLNYKTGAARLAAFKGKLVLLDFWATWCSNCYKKLHLLDSLQRLHADKLQVLLVSTTTSRDTKEKLLQFISRYTNHAGKKTVLPLAFNDSVAARYFPHSSLPYYVWISPDGTLLATSGSEDITAANIALAANGGTPAISGLALMEDFDLEQPLFANGNAGDGSGLLARSTLSRFIPGMAAINRHSRNSQKLTTQYKMINLPLLQLVKAAYGCLARNDRVIFELPESIVNCLLPLTDSAKQANSYAYELICPPMPYKQALQMIQQDMQRYFGLSARYAVMPAACYRLTLDTTKLQAYKSKGGKLTNKLNQPLGRYLQNGTLAMLQTWLNDHMQRYVLTDATLPYNLDMEIPDDAAASDEALLQTLAAKGIILTPVTGPVQQFIIYQTPKQSL